MCGGCTGRRATPTRQFVKIMPQRFLRPGITTSQRYNAVSWPAQTLFTRILTLVDDFGRYDAEMRLLKSHAFPFGDPQGREISIKLLEQWCTELDLADLCRFYLGPDGKKYLQVARWQERSRSEKSKFPGPTDDCEHFLRNPAESCGILPPSSSSSSSPVHHRHSTNGSGEPPAPSDEIWVEELSKSPAYHGIDVKREYAKMVVWCGAAKKMPTKRRFINWLNKCERPLSVVNFKRQSAPLDPAKINVAPEFKEWGKAKYPKRADDIEAYRTWADVPQVLREEWKQEKIRPLTEQLAAR